jgi:hypothetical protein
MKYLQFLSFFVFVSSTLNCSFVNAQSARSSSETEEQTVHVDLALVAGHDPPKFHASVMGDPVFENTKTKFILKIRNSTGENFRFDKIGVSCNCFEVLTSAKEIPADKEIEVSGLYFARRNRSGKYALNLQFTFGTQGCGSISVSGELAGTLEIENRHLYESNGSISVWKIPVLSTPPIDLQGLEVKLSASLRDLEARIEDLEGHPTIVVIGPENGLGFSGLLGELILKDPKSGIERSARVHFIKKPVIRISPLNARFYPIGGDEYQANVLVQSMQDVGSASGDDPKDERDRGKNNLVSIECISTKQPITIEQIRINDFLVRVKVKTKRPQTSLVDFEIPLEWKVVSDEGELNIMGSAILEGD